MFHRFLFAAALCVAIAANAQPAGSYRFEFAQPMLWDLTGDYTRSDDVGVVQLSLVHAPNGTVSGTGSVHATNGLQEIHASEGIAGRVAGVRRRVRFNAKGSGTVIAKIGGFPIPGTFRASLALVLDAARRVVAGREKATICVATQPCRTISTNTSFPLPPGMNGTWALDLDLDSTGKAVGGTAIVTLSGGRTLDFTVRGKYSPGTGRTRIRLSGPDRTTISLVLDRSNSIRTMRGRLLGQVVAFP